MTAVLYPISFSLSSSDLIPAQSSSPASSPSHRHRSSSPAPSHSQSSSYHPRTGDVNPLYSLGERVSTGLEAPVHILASNSNGDLIIRSGTPPSKLYHPHTWLPASNRSEAPSRPVASERGRDKGKAKSLFDPWSSPPDISSPSPLPQNMKATADENQGEDVVSGFREKEIAGSKADELRVKLHEWKAEREEPRGRSTERDEIRVKLDAIPITANGKSSADGVGVEDGADDIEDEESTHSLGNGHLTPAFSASSYYSTASEHLTINSSQSSFGRARTITPPPIELLPSNAVELDYNAEDESEVLDHTPVFDSTPQFVMNSRATPPIFTTSLSPNDLLPPPPSSPAPVSPQSSSSPRLSNSSSPHSTMRRSLTTGPSSYPSTSSSPPPVSSRKPPHHHPNRTQSYHAPQSFSHAQDNSFTSQPPPLDEVESSIAAQAELIRKARLAKAKEQEQQRQAEEGIGAPIMKRRSTRAGSGSEHGNGGVLVGNLIGTDHSAYVLMYNMLTGIRIGVSSPLVFRKGFVTDMRKQVSRCQAKLKRPLTDADYTARHKFSFDMYVYMLPFSL